MANIELENINLKFNIKKETRIKDYFIRNKNNSHSNMIVHALNSIDLSLSEGDRLGIIGHNGAGKSTLLKLIAGIYPQTSGSLSVNGSVACLFELATGFEMESSGWDNIYLRGLMLGQSPKEILDKTQEIADFSGLGEYLDMPVKYYSSGMFIRLAFSISTAIEPEILLLDEVIAAGDAAFLEKAHKRIKDLIGKVKILVFVSHSMESIKDFCNKSIWMEKGMVKMHGTPEEVSSAYIKSALGT